MNQPESSIPPLNSVKNCVKCGKWLEHEAPRLRYVNGGHGMALGSEAIERECPRCGYCWLEACKDAPEPAPAKSSATP